MRNGEPILSTVNFGTYHCVMYRWSLDEAWTFLATKGKGRRIFSSAPEAIREAKRILMPQPNLTAPAIDADEAMRQQWRKEKAEALKDETQRVFGGGHRPKIVFQNGRAIPVETKERARA